MVDSYILSQFLLYLVQFHSLQRVPAFTGGKRERERERESKRQGNGNWLHSRACRDPSKPSEKENLSRRKNGRHYLSWHPKRSLARARVVKATARGKKVPETQSSSSRRYCTQDNLSSQTNEQTHPWRGPGKAPHVRDLRGDPFCSQHHSNLRYSLHTESDGPDGPDVVQALSGWLSVMAAY